MIDIGTRRNKLARRRKWPSCCPGPRQSPRGVSHSGKAFFESGPAVKQEEKEEEEEEEVATAAAAAPSAPDGLLPGCCASAPERVIVCK